MARLRASWRTSLPVVQQPRNPQSESIARSPYDDHWDPPSNVLEGEVGQHLALLVAEHELLREVGQDAEAVRAGVDHEVEAASLAIEVQFTIIPERGGHNREHALEPRCNRLAHANLPRACCYVPVALQPNVWPDMSAAYRRRDYGSCRHQ